MKSTGIKDNNGVMILLGHEVYHNGNTYIVKWSKNLDRIVLRVPNDTGMNWRSLEWLRNVSRYCEVLNPTQRP